LDGTTTTATTTKAATTAGLARFWRFGHCAKHWDGKNVQARSAEECARKCAYGSSKCMYFAYLDSKLICSMYTGGENGDDCPNDGRYESFKLYVMNRVGLDPGRMRQYTTNRMHDGHCSRGWIAGMNRHFANLADCADHCMMTVGCSYISHSMENGLCALYNNDAGCPSDHKYGSYVSYRLLFSDSQEDMQVDLSYVDGIEGREYFVEHQGSHCSSGWLDGHQYHNVTIVKDCFNKCHNQKDCGYFSHDDERGMCALYHEGEDCGFDGRYPNYTSYRMKGVGFRHQVASMDYKFVGNGTCGMGSWTGVNKRFEDYETATTNNTGTMPDKGNTLATLCGRYCRASNTCGYFAVYLDRKLCVTYRSGKCNWKDHSNNTVQTFILV